MSLVTGAQSVMFVDLSAQASVHHGCYMFMELLHSWSGQAASFREL